MEESKEIDLWAMSNRKLPIVRYFFLYILWFFVRASATAQCPNKFIFTTDFQQITAIKPTENQLPSLQKWLINWQKCYPKTDSVYVNALIQVGLAEYSNHNYADAIAITKHVIPLYRQPHSTLKLSDLVKACYRIGVYYNSNEKNAEAISYLQQAVQLGKGKTEAKRFVANSHLYLIYAYFVKGDFEKALLHADLGSELSLEIGDTVAAAKIREQKGQVLSDLLRFAEAKTEVEKAIFMLRNHPEQLASVAGQHRLLGTIYRSLGRPDAELKELMTAYRLAEKVNHPNLSDFLISIGYHFYKEKNYRQAIQYYQKGIQIDKSEYSKIILLNRLGLAYARLGNYSEAFQLYQQGFKSMLVDYKGANPGSLPEAQTIRSIAQKDYLLTLIQDKADTWLDWAKATNNNPARLQNALTTYMLADTMIDYMRWEHTGQQSKLFWRQKTRSLYERAIETCYRLGDAGQAFRFFEKSRAVLLADKLNELGARQQLAPQLVAQEQRLREQVHVWQSTLSGQKSGTAAHSQAREKLLTTQDALDNFLRQLEKTNPAYYRYKYDNATTPLPDVQRWLGQQKSSLATYFIGDSSIYMLGVTPTQSILIRQPVDNYLSLAANYKLLLADPQTTNQQFKRMLSTGNQLYRQLLAPLNLPDGRVVVSPDGFFLPFDAFSRVSDRADFLVNYQAFSYTYSVNILLKVRGEASPTGEFLGMAPVKFKQNLGQSPLKGSDEALQRIGNRFASPTLLTYATATRAAFTTKAPANRILQLFTHADADTSNQQTPLDEYPVREPELFFADSTLRLSDLTDKHPFQSELLVLSACKTGIGANRKGEGIFSLARGFASVGIPSVITTLWSVEDRPTYQLTELFYQYLANGFPKDEALQRAKLDFMKQGTQTDQLPNRWAGLILIGNAEPLKQRLAIRSWQFMLGSLVLLVIGGWVMRRRRKISV